jgi:hypothetical protein
MHWCEILNLHNDSDLPNRSADFGQIDVKRCAMKSILLSTTYGSIQIPIELEHLLESSMQNTDKSKNWSAVAVLQKILKEIFSDVSEIYISRNCNGINYHKKSKLPQKYQKS